MHEGITVEVSDADRVRLEAIVIDRNSPQIVLLTADGLGTGEIMRQAGTSKVTVWRWQERFMRAGVEGLLRNKTRRSRIPPLPRDRMQQAQDLIALGGATGGPYRITAFKVTLWD